MPTASYAGAEQAIKDYAAANWPTTPIALPNERFDAPLDGDGNPLPWIALEIQSFGNQVWGQGSPGNLTWHKEGAILGHVFVPINTGDALAKQYADAFGEIFRAKQLYSGVSPGCYVRTWAPDVDGGGKADGNYYRVSVAIDFEYWHRG